jgi:hypothetical protein
MLPFQQIQSADAKGSELHVRMADTVAVFELGPQAEKWALTTAEVPRSGARPRCRPDAEKRWQCAAGRHARAERSRPTEPLMNLLIIC